MIVIIRITIMIMIMIAKIMMIKTGGKRGFMLVLVYVVILAKFISNFNRREY
jgi:hypothetical protein